MDPLKQKGATNKPRWKCRINNALTRRFSKFFAGDPQICFQESYQKHCYPLNVKSPIKTIIFVSFDQNHFFFVIDSPFLIFGDPQKGRDPQFAKPWHDICSMWLAEHSCPTRRSVEVPQEDPKLKQKFTLQRLCIISFIF